MYETFHLARQSHLSFYGINACERQMMNVKHDEDEKFCSFHALLVISIEIH